jgi:hypothetical protein
MKKNIKKNEFFLLYKMILQIKGNEELTPLVNSYLENMFIDLNISQLTSFWTLPEYIKFNVFKNKSYDDIKNIVNSNSLYANKIICKVNIDLFHNAPIRSVHYWHGIVVVVSVTTYIIDANCIINFNSVYNRYAVNWTVNDFRLVKITFPFIKELLYYLAHADYNITGDLGFPIQVIIRHIETLQTFTGFKTLYPLSS